MLRFIKSVAFMLALSLMVPAIALADHFPSHNSWGNVNIEVLDQDNNTMGGVWFLHEGTGNQGMVVRNGTLSETFTMPFGSYFLRAESVMGYESFQVTSENPQDIVPRGYITFTVKYYRNGYAAGQTGPVDQNPPAPAPGEPQEEPAPMPEPGPSAGQADDAMTEPDRDGAQDQVLEMPRREILRSPLRVPTPLSERLSYTGESGLATGAAGAQPMELAVTGPAGMLTLLLMASGLSGLWITRRKRA